jgi:hypothetical protein
VTSEHIPIDDASPPVGDITFKVTTGGFEIMYSDRIAGDYQDLVDQSADWLEDQLGVVNLGQIDHKILMADGLLADELKNGLIAWWSAKVDDLVLD